MATEQPPAIRVTRSLASFPPVKATNLCADIRICPKRDRIDAKLVELMTIGVLGLSLVWSGPGLGEERAGDEFCDTALEYDHQADVAIEEAARADKHEAGLFLQLAMIHRGMADIKRRAAELADEDRWDEIDWDEYHELEEHREQLVAELTGSASHEMQPDDTGHDFLVAAREYEAEAATAREHAALTDGVERVVFEELSGIFAGMAEIKYQAAAAERDNRHFDWAEYEELARRRDDLLGLIEHAR